VLLSHGWAVEVLRRECPRAEVGIVLDSWPAHPASDDDADRRAAGIVDGVRNRWFFSPVLRGRYPEDMLEHFEPLTPPLQHGDVEAIAAPLDFVGVNNYSRTLVHGDPAGGEPVEVRSPAGQLTDMGWEVYPDGLSEVLVRLHDDYSAPSLYVTENGAAFSDVRSHDGHVHDIERRDYLAAYVESIHRTMSRGIPVRGYFVWSLLDNFEWAYGYSKRFGLVYVDYPTLERIPKDSFYWYRTLISRRGSDTTRRGLRRRAGIVQCEQDEAESRDRGSL
jgi:beta-glucosidase